MDLYYFEFMCLCVYVFSPASIYLWSCLSMFTEDPITSQRKCWRKCDVYVWLHKYHISGCQPFIVQASAVTWQLHSAPAQVAHWPPSPGIQAPPHFINPGQPPAASYHGSPSSHAAAALSGRRARRLLCPPAPRHARSYGSFALVTVRW